jgi:hypothetical protein
LVKCHPSMGMTMATSLSLFSRLMTASATVDFPAKS